MTTSYADKDDWADSHGFADWAAFLTAGNTYPNATQLDAALKKATRILNNRMHLNCGTTNITDTTYLTDIKDYCLTITNRILDQQNARGSLGGLMFTQGMQNWSGADYLMSYERTDIEQISLALGFRLVGDVR